MNTVALFDFDETITQKDTLISGIKYVVPSWRFFPGIVCTLAIRPLFKKRIISSTTMKTIVSKLFFTGLSSERIREKSRLFLREKVDCQLDTWHMNRLSWHREQGHRIVVVTASFDLWVEQWCHEQGLELISTRLEQKNGRFTGHLIGTNCFGSEKVLRIREVVNLSEYEEIYAYTDSLSDKGMLDCAKYPYLNGKLFVSDQGK